VSGAAFPWAGRCIMPEEWCADPKRRARAKIPAELEFRTKPQLARALALQAAGWEIPSAPVLADSAYGDDTDFRGALEEDGLEYLVAVSPNLGVFGPETSFAVPERPGRGRPPTRPKARVGALEFAFDRYEAIRGAIPRRLRSDPTTRSTGRKTRCTSCGGSSGDGNRGRLCL